MDHFPLNRRALLGGMAAFAAQGARAAGGRLVLVTSYPQPVISRYVDAFSAANPNVHVDVAWHTAGDAVTYVSGPGKGLADVYWSPAPAAFIDLARKGLFRPLDLDRDGLPGKIGPQWIADPARRFEATEVAGYGIMFDPAYLARFGLPQPKQWEDLTDPAFRGHFRMPVPSAIGFAPAITEIILQARGWDGGWSLLSELADAAELEQGRGENMAHPAAGQPGVTITIDFLAVQAIARGAKVRFVYPSENAFEPTNIAILANGPNPQAALAYVNFVLSEAGQELLLDPDVRRLPVRPALYGRHPELFNPFATPVTNRYDAALYGRRKAIDNQIFDRWLVAPRARRKAIQARIEALASPRTAGAIAQARRLLATVPLDEAAALAEKPVKGQVPAWDGQVAELLAQAEALLG